LCAGRPHSQNERGKPRSVVEAPAGSLVEVTLPEEYPQIPADAPIYCSSSQAVKQRYRHGRPKPGLFRTRHTLDLAAAVTADRLTVMGRAGPVEVTRTLAGPFTPARDAAGTAAAVRAAFEKLGDTRLALGDFRFDNPHGLFVPASKLNPLRREL